VSCINLGGELGVGEAEGAVGHGERRDFDVCDGDLRSLDLKTVR